MVQVDVFWGYGWGASLAVAAGRTLAQKQDPYDTKYWAQTIGFLALSWAPTGLLLLLRHPSWETMQAASNLQSMSEWLILAFGVTNITQGMLGFWVGQKLMAQGKFYAAQLNWLLGYFGMFFILLYGWDGLGYDRFLYDRDLLPGSPAWTPGVGTAAGVGESLVRFLGSSVAMTLYIDGVLLLPPFFWLFTRWFAESAEADREQAAGTGCLVATYFAGALIVGLGTAAIAALTVRGVAYGLGVPDHVARGLSQAPASTSMHILAYFNGLPLGTALAWFALLKPGRPFHSLLKPLWLTPDRA